MPLASVTSAITEWIAQNGVYAVFLLMAADALLPVGGELVMLYAGVLAAGAAGHDVSLFGASPSQGPESYVVLALAGSIGYLVGALVGWWMGRVGGRALIARHGRLLHLNQSTLTRAERWFDRYGWAAVLLGRLTPVVRSFISIPAGIFSIPLPRYFALTAIGSALWCFGFAGGGWALGGSWREFHDGFRYADYLAVALVLVLLGALAFHRVRSRGRTAHVEHGDPSRS